jgi:3-oxoacyl-[acyl-carrier protein] reductase
MLLGFSQGRGRAIDLLDILVNNAEVCGFAPLDVAQEEEFRRQFNIDVLGITLAVKNHCAHL